MGVALTMLMSALGAFFNFFVMIGKALGKIAEFLQGLF